VADSLKSSILNFNVLGRDLSFSCCGRFFNVYQAASRQEKVVLLLAFIYMRLLVSIDDLSIAIDLPPPSDYHSSRGL
jgi:hypothetical protein